MKSRVTNPKAVKALRLMRNGLSLAEACREAGIKQDAFLREVGDAVYHDGASKRWKAAKTDSLNVLMNVPTEKGPVATLVHGLRERIRLSRYENAVKMWRGGKRGALKALSAFEGLSVGGRVLITDPKILARLEEADRLDVDEIYVGLGGRR